MNIFFLSSTSLQTASTRPPVADKGKKVWVMSISPPIIHVVTIEQTTRNLDGFAKSQIIKSSFLAVVTEKEGEGQELQRDKEKSLATPRNTFIIQEEVRRTKKEELRPQNSYDTIDHHYMKRNKEKYSWLYKAAGRCIF